MAYTTVDFTATQVIGFPSIVVLTDTHTGTDVLVTQRRATFTTNLATTLVPTGTGTSYVQWAIANSSLSADIMPHDYALSIKVDWLDVTNVVLYTKTTLYDFTLYSETFYFGLTQEQTSTPNIVNDTNYYTNKLILRCNIDEANNAVTYGGDITSSQSALDRAAYMIANESNFF